VKCTAASLYNCSMEVAGRVKFGIVGSGWRAGCYLSTASLLGEGFDAVGVAGRNPATRASLAGRWKVAEYDDAARLVERESPDFLLVTVDGGAMASVLEELMRLDLPLLAETPPASTVEELERLWAEAERRKARIQVAEQYWLQPMQQARLAAVAEGLVGTPSYVHASVNHGYHNISLIRKYLGIGFEEAEIRATAFSAPATEGPGRGGPPVEERISPAEHILGLFDFGANRKGLFDFERNQHRSWIRSARVVVRGERGEIADTRIAYLEDFKSPVFDELERVQTGGDSDFEDCYLKGVMLGNRWLYRNPFAPARLSDEEISQAACLAAMGEYVRTGKGFYPLGEAAQDAYLALSLREAVETGEPVSTASRAWAR
jgi:predicted dehydrogenase